MISQCTKFEVSRFTRFEAMNGGAKCKKWGGLGRLGGHSRSSAMSPFHRTHTTDDVIFAHKPRLLDVAAQLKRSAQAALGLAINCAQ